MSQATFLLQRICNGDRQASAELLPLVYDELRKLAALELTGEDRAITLQPTALVHEAYLRLVGSADQPQWDGRGHFYAAAATAMRRILVDAARRRQAKKRGGGLKRIALDEAAPVQPLRHPDLIALDEALGQLGAAHPRLAQLVELRYFAGLSMEEAANLLEISQRSAERDWTYAKAWLQTAMKPED